MAGCCAPAASGRSWDGNDDSGLLNDLAARGFLMVVRNNRPAIGRDANVEDYEDKSSVAYLDYFSARAVDHVFAVKWNDALKNGALLGMVDFGEMDHVRNADQKFWPSIGMSVAETRNLFGLVYPLAVVNGVLDRMGGRSTGMVRPGFAGSQRLGWTTTGDSVPTYANFRAYPRHAELDAFRLFQRRTGHRRLGRKVTRHSLRALVRGG